jgi:DNA-3-methyladenine glycosylase I
MAKEKIRCQWAASNELFHAYHDQEWGVPVHDDRLLFEMLNLEGAQAGLTWLTILQKRAHYQQVFELFDAAKVAGYTDARLEKILLDPGIVRNRLKVYGVRKNAIAFLQVQAEFGSFDQYIWQFCNGQPIINHWKTLQEIPAKTALSDSMSKDLKKRGFTFVGSTICYAFMQATGMVHDHTTDCFRYGKK